MNEESRKREAMNEEKSRKVMNEEGRKREAMNEEKSRKGEGRVEE
jgi:hypothetical protein